MSLRVKNMLADEQSHAVPGLPPSFKDLFSENAKNGADAPVTGLFLCSGDVGTAEICAGAGFDYLLIDGEHSPLSLASIQNQLRTIAAYPTLPLVRVPSNDEVLIKQYLDLGAQSLLVPMVDTADDARAAVAAVQYPGAGVRGVGSALARSARWNRVPDYLEKARDSISLVVQIESASGVANVEQILAVSGVDALFIGPSDLAASMGFLGQQNHPEVVEAVHRVIATAKSHGKIVGVNAFVHEQAQQYLQAGVDFVNVGADVALLARASENLAQSWQRSAEDLSVKNSY